MRAFARSSSAPDARSTRAKNLSPLISPGGNALTFRREWLTVLDLFPVARQLDIQSLAKKKLRGVRKEIDQPIEIDLTPQVFWFVQWLVEKRWWLVPVFSSNPPGRVVVDRIAEAAFII